MAYFDEAGVLAGQMAAHYGMNEIYVHIIASGILFLSSLISIALLLQAIKGSGFRWPGVIHAMLYTGLIGFGEFVEHVFPLDPFLSNALHYLHHIAAPVALLFFYLGIEEFIKECTLPKEEIHTISDEVALGVFAGVFILAAFMGSLGESPFSAKIEGPFLLLILLPLLALAGFLVWRASHIRKSMITFYFPAFGLALSLLVLDIWAGRLGDVNRIASLYIIAHSLQTVFQVAAATTMLLFTAAVIEGIKEGILHTCEVTRTSKPRKNRKERNFRLDEQ